MASAKPIPDGYHAVTPYLIVKGAARAIDFYVKALGARELFRVPQPDGRVDHAELQIGDSRVMLADEHPEIGARSPQSFGGSPATIHLYVDDVDATVSRAVQAGGAGIDDRAFRLRPLRGLRSTRTETGGARSRRAKGDIVDMSNRHLEGF